MKKNILEGTIFALIATVLLGLTLFSYIFGSGDSSFMDVWGWIYYLLSSLMHAGLFVLVPFVVVFLPLALAGVKNKVSIPIMGFIYGLLVVVAVVNRYVFQLYHFHINGFVLDMLFSEGASEIFVFSFWLYVKVALVTVGIGLAVFGLVRLSRWLSGRVVRVRKFYVCSLSTFLLTTLLSQGIHVYGAATLHPSILECDAFLPYYFPLSMNSALDSMGIIDKTDIATVKISENSAPIDYPRNPLVVDPAHRATPNIVFIVIDSWNFRTLTGECMPNVWRFKENAEFYANHWSSSNGTRGGIFGLFTGLSSYYWKSFEYSSLKPVLIEQLQEYGYDIQVYPSANFRTPPFDRMFFKGIDINTTTKGASAYDRDCKLTDLFLRDLADTSRGQRPFFSFLFYDMAHAIALPEERNHRFQPAWSYADYTRLNNNTNPQPFFNLYRNCLYQIDSLVGRVLEGLESRGLMDNTVVLITGDHGQEFNENHKNYWGHGSNYTGPQIHVPLIVSRPQGSAATYSHRTTHYDISTTLLHDVLGVQNPTTDYSMGLPLADTTFRNWHVVGDNLNYAFIIDHNTIVEKKPSGMLDICDSTLNPLKNFKLNAVELNNAINRLNMFYKQ